MTDLGLRLLRKGDDISNVINYRSASTNGKPLRSSTFVIRNSRGKPIAFVCINYDLTSLSILREFIDSSFPTNFPIGEDALKQSPTETYPRDVQDIVKTTVSEILKRFDKPVSLMKKQDKLRVVELLDETGIFGIKRAHYYAASALNTLRYTIYNYLNEVRHHSKGELIIE